MTPVAAVAVSENRKTGPVAATYTGIRATCPATCAFHPERGGACYAYFGRTGPLTRRLDRAAAGLRPIDVARAEANAIDRLTPNPLGLRIHVAGDARTPAAARELGAAARRWRGRKGGPAWTYTHAWRTVPRGQWGGAVSVLASIDRIDDAPAARAAGYAPALVVPAFPAGARAWTARGIRWIPCPEQTGRARSCVDCGLCFRGDALARRGAGIAFAVHGPGAGAWKRRLAVLATEPPPGL